MNVIDILLNKFLGLDAATIKTEEDKRAYDTLNHLYRLMSLLFFIGLPGAIYVLITVYLPSWGK